MDILPYFIVLSQLVAVILSSVPVGFPSSDDSQAIPYWIGLLSHIFLLALNIVIGFDDHGNMIGTFSDSVGPPLGSGPQTFQHASTIHSDLLDIKIGLLNIGLLVLGLPIGDGRQKKFFQFFGSFLGVEP